jgi:hypothetical protein
VEGRRSKRTNMRIDEAIDKAIAGNNERELARGFIMYEYVRTLNARQFSELCERNRKGEVFDDMILEAIAAQ